MSYCNSGNKPLSPLRQSTVDYMTVRGLSENTQQSYLWELDRLAKFYGCSPSQVEADQIRKYILERIDQGLSPASTNVSVSTFKMFYTHVLGCPERVEHLTMRKVPERLPKAMEESQVKALLMSTYDIRYRAALRLAYSTGLRLSEVVSVKVTDIDSGKRLVRVACGKGGHERAVFLPSSTLEALGDYYRQVYPKPDSWLFYGTSTDEPIKPNTLRQAFNKARDRAGIGKQFTFHSLRHSYATHLLQRGATRDEVQDLLGHKSPESTRTYARITSAMFERLDHPADQLNR